MGSCRPPCIVRREFARNSDERKKPSVISMSTRSFPKTSTHGSDQRGAVISFSFSAARLLCTSALAAFLGAAICFGQASDDVDVKLEQLSSEAQAAQQRGDYVSAAKSYEELA